MKLSSIIWVVVVVLVIIVVGGVWYWSSSMGTQNANNTSTSTVAGGGNTGATGGNAPMTTTPPVVPNAPIVLNTGSTSTLGIYLVATNGMTLYESAADQPGVSKCTGTCAAVWPPYTIPASEAASPIGGTSGISGKIGVIMRANGTMQVTYNNMPLYFYENDRVVGNAKGQNVGGFVVVKP